MHYILMIQKYKSKMNKRAYRIKMSIIQKYDGTNNKNQKNQQNQNKMAILEYTMYQ